MLNRFFKKWFGKQQKSDLICHAERELDLIGMTENSPDQINRDLRKHILAIIKIFSEEDHSGSTASYTTSVINTLLRFNPLSPLTGNDDEWNEVSDGLYQNKRCSHVFKNSKGPYDIDAVVFEEDWIDEDGEVHTQYFTNSRSVKPIKFPYTPTQVNKKVPSKKNKKV